MAALHSALIREVAALHSALIREVVALHNALILQVSLHSYHSDEILCKGCVEASAKTPHDDWLDLPPCLVVYQGVIETGLKTAIVFLPSPAIQVGHAHHNTEVHTKL